MHATRWFATQRATPLRLCRGDNEGDVFRGHFHVHHLQASVFWEQPFDDPFQQILW